MWERRLKDKKVGFFPFRFNYYPYSAIYDTALYGIDKYKDLKKKCLDFLTRGADVCSYSEALSDSSGLWFPLIQVAKLLNTIIIRHAYQYKTLYIDNKLNDLGMNILCLT